MSASPSASPIPDDWLTAGVVARHKTFCPRYGRLKKAVDRLSGTAGGAPDGLLSACRQRASDNPEASGPAGMCPAGRVHQAVAGCSRQRKTDSAAGCAESGNQAAGGCALCGRGTALMGKWPAVFWCGLSVGGPTAPASGGCTGRKWCSRELDNRHL